MKTTSATFTTKDKIGNTVELTIWYENKTYDINVYNANGSHADIQNDISMAELKLNALKFAKEELDKEDIK